METWIKIKMGNAAFVDNEGGETARILRGLADRIDGHPHFSAGHCQGLMDINGNDVGFCGVFEDERCLAVATEDYGD